MKKVLLDKSAPKEPIVENLHDYVAAEISGHGGNGTLRARFFHQRYQGEIYPDNLNRHVEYVGSAWNFFSYNVLPVGATVKKHRHVYTDEIYFILSGKARLTVNGKTRIISSDDCALTLRGSTHSIDMVEVDLVFIAVEIEAKLHEK